MRHHITFTLQVCMKARRITYSNQVNWLVRYKQALLKAIIRIGNDMSWISKKDDILQAHKLVVQKKETLFWQPFWNIFQGTVTVSIFCKYVHCKINYPPESGFPFFGTLCTPNFLLINTGLPLHQQCWYRKPELCPTLCSNIGAYFSDRSWL